MKTLKELFTEDMYSRFAAVYRQTAQVSEEVANLQSRTEAVLLYKVMAAFETKNQAVFPESTAKQIYFEIALKGVSIDPAAKLAFIDIRNSKNGRTFNLQIQTEGKMQMLANRGIKADPVSFNLVYENDKYTVGLNENGQIALTKYEKTFANKGNPIFAYVVFSTRSDLVPFIFDYDQLLRLKTMGKSTNEKYGTNPKTVDPEFWITKAIKHGLTRLLHQAKEAEDDTEGDTDGENGNDSDTHEIKQPTKADKLPAGIPATTPTKVDPIMQADDNDIF